jgi:hypothetical protein
MKLIETKNSTGLEQGSQIMADHPDTTQEIAIAEELSRAGRKARLRTSINEIPDADFAATTRESLLKSTDNSNNS